MLGIEIQNGRGTEMQCSNANGVYSEFHVIKHELMHPNKEKSTRKQPMKMHKYTKSDMMCCTEAQNKPSEHHSK